MFQTVITPLDPVTQEIVMAQILENNDVVGFEQEDNQLCIYHNQKQSFDFLLEKLAVSIQVNELADQNWNAVWESNFEPVTVDDFCILRANFHPQTTAAQYDIIITPKMSFGTGHHATTFQVIQAMRNIDFSNKTICDYGTGTGVLAILADKMGAHIVDAIDNDDWSIENTHENIVANNCSSINVIKDYTIATSKTYDVILANINKNILLQNMASISRALQVNGTLVLSGILTNDELDLRLSIEQNAMIINNISEKNGWLCFVCVKKN